MLCFLCYVSYLKMRCSAYLAEAHEGIFTSCRQPFHASLLWSSEHHIVLDHLLANFSHSLHLSVQVRVGLNQVLCSQQMMFRFCLQKTRQSTSNFGMVFQYKYIFAMQSFSLAIILILSPIGLWMVSLRTLTTMV